MDNPQGSVDVPLSLFGGVNLELAPSDLPEGISPDCQDTIFLPGSVKSRPGFHRYLPLNQFGLTPITFMKTYLLPTDVAANVYMSSDANGSTLWVEYPAGSGTVSQIGNRLNPSMFALATNLDGRLYLAFSDGNHGMDQPLQLVSNPNVPGAFYLDRVTQDGPGDHCICADSAAGGHVTAGTHQFVVLFQTRNGFITAPSPIGNWTAAGGFRVLLTDIPLGPPNVIARIVAFTGAGGGNFFYIPVIPFDNGTVAGTATVIPDNTTTTITMDFTDNILFNSIAIDIPGNNLFANVSLPQCLGVFAYSQRLMYYGLDNNVQNFLNMGFDGGMFVGSTAPLGWNLSLPGAALQNSSTGGFEVVFSSNGTSPYAMLTQNAYADNNNVAILKGNTTYQVKLRALTGTATGQLVVDVYSASLASTIISGAIPLSSVSQNFRGTVVYPLGTTPVTIPSDATLRIYVQNMPNGTFVIVDDLEILYANDPWVSNRAIMSYVNAPEQFDALTGQIGPAVDPTSIMCCSILKDTLRIKTQGGMHSTNDNGTSEPSGWTINTFSRTVGAVSIRGGDPGMWGSGDTAEDWDLTVSRGGLYLDFAGDLYKISQEIQPLWDSINWNVAYTIWCKNDPIVRRIYLGLPIYPENTPSTIAVMDYRELDAAFQIAAAAPVHISYTGRMISSDLTRKWTTWPTFTNSGELLQGVLSLQHVNHQMFFGANYAAAPNVYYLDPAKLSDDDVLSAAPTKPYYTTYAFLNHEAEVALGTGVHRKLYAYQTVYASGKGLLNVTPLVDSLGNTWPSPPGFLLQSAPSYDIEFPLNVLGERCFFKFYTIPAQSVIVSLPSPVQIQVQSAYPFGQSTQVSIYSLPGLIFQTTVNVVSIDKPSNTITVSTPVGSVAGYLLTDVSYPDNSFSINKVVTSIKADPWAPVRGAW